MWGILLALVCFPAGLLADGEDKFAKRVQAVGQNVMKNRGYQVDSRTADTQNTPDASVCRNTSTIRTCGAIITSNNTVFRSPVANNSTWNYPSNVDCSWTIRAPIGYVVRFEFLCFFSTEATSIGLTCEKDDYLEIKNTSERTFQYCGSHVIEELDAYETDGNEAILTFHSNSALTAQGFVVRADFVKKYPDMCFDRATIRTCGSTIVSNNTIFRSPVTSSSNWTYPANVDCSWTIRAPIGYVVRFEFLCFFSTESTSTCRNDYLQIKNTTGRNFRYCGAHAIEKLDAYETDGNEATLTFRSNSALAGQGFVVRADFVKKYPEMCFNSATIRTCGSTILSNNTIFRSPVTSSSNWTYPANVDCSWTIRAPIGYVVRFEFLCFFSTEASSIGSTCDNDDYLKITNTSGRTAARYCGAHDIEDLDAYETDGNEAILTFHSNSAVTGHGFVVRTDFVQKYPETCFDSTTIRSCGSVITTNNTIIRSPIISDGTWRYPTSQDCSWTVRAPAKTKVKLEFLCFFDVRRRFVTIGSCDDANLLVQPKIGDGYRYCGPYRDLEPFETSSNEIALTFRSDSSTSLGFVIKVTFSSAALPAFNIAMIFAGLFASILTSG